MIKRKMKMASLFAISGLAVMMTGCSNDETLSGGQPAKGSEIAFRVSETRVGSSLKAGIADETTITNFTISGITDYDWSDPLLDAVVVTRSLDGSSWDYAPKAVWPDAGKTVKFYAFSPGNSRNMESFEYDYLSYVIPQTANQQEDFLVAVRDTTMSASGTPQALALNFKHVLSRVLVNARAAKKGVDIVVDSVIFVNLHSSGLLYLDPDAPTATGNYGKVISTGIPMDAGGFVYASYNPAEIAGITTHAYVTLWQFLGAMKSYPIDIRANGVKISNDGSSYTALTGMMSALMVMPQETSYNEAHDTPQDDDFYLKIVYKVGGKKRTAYKRVRDYWTRTGSFTFEAGKAYEFNLAIDVNAVELTLGSINGYVTDPGTDGIPVDRVWEVGDLYDNGGPNGEARYVATIDGGGQPVTVRWYNQFAELVSAWNAMDNYLKDALNQYSTASEALAAILISDTYKTFREEVLAWEAHGGYVDIHEIYVTDETLTFRFNICPRGKCFWYFCNINFDTQTSDIPAIPQRVIDDLGFWITEPV